MPITVSIVEDNDKLRATLARVLNRADSNEALATFTLRMRAPGAIPRNPPTPASCPAITLAPAALQDGTFGGAYQDQVQASGGKGPYTFAVAKFGGRNWSVFAATILLVPSVLAAIYLKPGTSFTTTGCSAACKVSIPRAATTTSLITRSMRCISASPRRSTWDACCSPATAHMSTIRSAAWA